MYVDVLLPLRLDRPFTYFFKKQEEQRLPEVGMLVEVSFRGKPVRGVIWNLLDSPPPSHLLPKIKPLLKVYDLPSFRASFCHLIEWVARYTLSPLGLVLKLALTSSDFLDPFPSTPTLSSATQTVCLSQEQTVRLSREQADAVKTLSEAVLSQTFKVTLLDGVTGSGKTEVYLEAIAQALRQQKQSLILLPEIALTPQTLQRFEKRFGVVPEVWHSGLGKKERHRTWQGVLKGTSSVVIGARSALFLPFPKLGLIVVDEEHDASYKQEETVLYQGRDMAVVRAHLEKIPLILASATPSLESYVNMCEGRYAHVSLKKRHGRAILPTLKVLDRRQAKEKVQGVQWLARSLKNAIQETLERQEQILLFLNRRGYAPLTLCGDCGERLSCPGCAAWLVAHRSRGTLLCHHCGFEQPLPSLCPSCQKEDSFVACGPGVERLEEEVRALFPKARIVVLSSDQKSLKERELSLKKIEQGDVDLIIGTQMVAKGHHFPGLTLVGVIDADLGFSGGDLRASEKTYQLLHQVAGRAGRAEHKGQVLLQTFMPEHPVLKALVCGDREAFLEAERYSREAFDMPPYGRLASLIVSGVQEDLVEAQARHLAHFLSSFPKITVLGPAPAPLTKLRNRFRWRLLLKAPKEERLQPLLRRVKNEVKLPHPIKLQIDIDPYSFL